MKKGYFVLTKKELKDYLEFHGIVNN